MTVVDSEVRERFDKIDSTLERASTLMLEAVQNYHEMTKTAARIIQMQEENAKQISRNTKDISDLRELIRLSLRPKNGH